MIGFGPNSEDKIPTFPSDKNCFDNPIDVSSRKTIFFTSYLNINSAPWKSKKDGLKYIHTTASLDLIAEIQPKDFFNEVSFPCKGQNSLDEIGVG